MTFHWALDQLKEGKPVRRENWHRPYSSPLQQHMWIDYVGQEEIPIIRFLFSQTLTAEDLFADDWVEHTRRGFNAQSK